MYFSLVSDHNPSLSCVLRRVACDKGPDLRALFKHLVVVHRDPSPLWYMSLNLGQDF